MDTAEKRHLAQLVRQVAAGTIAIDDLEGKAIEYDDGSLFHELLMSEVYDLAEQPAEFCTGRFRGRKRLNDQRRKSLARLSLFLYSDSEYKWPPFSGSPNNSYDPLLLIITALLASCGLFVIAISPLISAMFFALAFSVFWFSRRLSESACQEWVNHHNTIGEYDLWPFRFNDDYNQALANPVLLRGNADNAR